MYEKHEYTELIGKTFVAVENVSDEELVFVSKDGSKYTFYHMPTCCERVGIEDIVGELSDLVGSPIVRAEETTHKDTNPEGVKVPKYQDYFTWTFYNFATVHGHVTVRWYGTSNGWYSERVDFKAC